MATQAYHPHPTQISLRDRPRSFRSVARTHCYLCDSEGKILYSGLSDRLWNVPGNWNLRQCPRHECQLIWIDPCPVPEDIPSIYSEYYTHEPAGLGAMERLRRNLAPFVFSGTASTPRSFAYPVLKLLSRLSVFRDFTAGAVMWLQDMPPGDMLDFGFGAGQLVMRLRDMGWNVAGVEFDHKVLTMAREKLGMDVRSSILSFPENRFDVITLSHVIEHVPDPKATLRECTSRLRPGGRIVLATPNTKSLGHEYFQENWRPLEPPRHLFLFSPQSLAQCAERAGLEVEVVRTSARSACFSWYSSQLLRKKKSDHKPALSKNNDGPGLFLKASGALFQLWEHYLGGEQAGEEVVLTARRPQQGAN